jgi:hypothetical protein
MKRGLFLSGLAYAALLWLVLAGPSRAHEIRSSFHIHAYDIAVTVPEGFDCLEIKALLDLQRVSPGGDLSLALGRNFTGAHMDILSVLDAAGRSLPFSFKDDVLSLSVPHFTARGETASILIHYKISKCRDTAKDPYGAFAFEVSAQDIHINASITRTDNWYPRPLGWKGGDRLPPFRLSVDVPSRLEVMASGNLDKVLNNGGRSTYCWHNYAGLIDRSLYFFAAEARKVTREYPDSFVIDVYRPAGAREENCAALADLIHKSYVYFERAYGPSPARRYKIMAFSGGYSGLCNSMTVPIALFTGSLESNEIGFPQRTVIHEVSHTWWGNMVSANAKTDYWLYEGFAKFSEILALRRVLGSDAGLESFRRLKALSLNYMDCSPPVLFAQKAENRMAQTVSAYYEGALFLRMLEYIMGDVAFFEGMKDYVKSCRGICATTNDFRNAMDRHSPVKLKAIFDGYLAGPFFGRYTVTYVAGRLEPQKRVLHSVLVQNTGTAPLWTVIEMKGMGETRRRNIAIEKEGAALFEVEESLTDGTGKGALGIDPDGVFPLCEDGQRGAGGMAVYEGRVVKIRDVIENTPLFRAGVRDGDVLLEIDGATPLTGDICRLNGMLVRPRGARSALKIKNSRNDVRNILVRY